VAKTTQAAEISALGGVRTFLIADIRGYTHFTLEHGDAEAARLAARFADVASEAVGGRGGEVVELRGDEALAVFTSTREALRAGLELQAMLTRETDANPSLPLRAGIGIDAGEAIPVSGGYRGAALNLAARLCSLAGPGEVLVTETVTALARKVDGMEYVDRGTAQLKGFVDPVKVIEVRARLSPPGPLSRNAGEGEMPLSDSPSPVLRERGLGGEGLREVLQPLPIGGYLGSLPGSPLVGRSAELEQTQRTVEAVLVGTSKLILLAGEPGAGKTRLAQEVTLQLRDRDFLIAAGRCYEPQATVPFYPFLDALTTAYGSAPASIRSQVPRTWPDLGRLLPGLGLPIPDFAGPQDQQRLFWAITGFLQAIAAERPVALLLDDLHWADSASLELVQHIARHTAAERILLLGTYRDVEVGRQHPLESALRDLRREDLVESVEVRRLGHADTAALMASTVGEEEEVSEEFSSLVYRRTEGNPFFIQQVMRVLVERGDIFRRDGHWDRRSIDEIEVPESVRSVVGQRLSRLSEAAQEILREASVLGQTFGFDGLQVTVDRPERELEDALDAAIAAGLVRDAGRDTYAFDHALTQGSLYGELSSRRRRRLHLAAAEAIEKLPENKRAPRAAELAWHFLQADETARALEWSLLAGAGAEAVFAHSDAEYHYRIARDLARELGERDREAVAAESLGRTLLSLARNDEALPVREEAAAIYHERGDLDAEARVVAAIGAVYFQMNRAPDGVSRILPLLEAREPDMQPATAAILLVELANLYWMTGKHEEAARFSERAAERAEEAGDNSLLARAELRWGTTLGTIEQWANALPHLNRAIELAEETGDLMTLARSLNNRSVAYERTKQWESVWQDLERQLELSRRLGNPDQLVYALGNMSMTAFWIYGDWQRARPYADEALRFGRRLRRTRATFHVTMVLLMRAMMGDREAFSQLEELATETQRVVDEATWVRAQDMLGRLEILSDPASTRRRLESALDHPSTDEEKAIIGAFLARACVLTGDLDLAEELVAKNLPELGPHRFERGEWLETEGMLRTRQHRWEEALGSFEAALFHSREYSFPFLRADTLLEMGVMHARKGELDRAAARFDEALASYRRIGAKLYIEHAEQLRSQLLS
jgi:class 3 adenylate cyclase/tetratricopeptide (TPR) repeat protein